MTRCRLTPALHTPGTPTRGATAPPLRTLGVVAVLLSALLVGTQAEFCRKYEHVYSTEERLGMSSSYTFASALRVGCAWVARALCVGAWACGLVQAAWCCTLPGC